MPPIRDAVDLERVNAVITYERKTVRDMRERERERGKLEQIEKQKEQKRKRKKRSEAKSRQLRTNTAK